MKVLATLLAVTAAALTAFTAAAQPADSLALLRKEALAEARYLKSIYKTDAAIERLSGFLKPGAIDEEILSELADCHFVAGDYETAAGTYQLLSLQAPQNLYYRIREMQLAYRMKDYGASARLGREVLAMDSIPAIAALTGDAYNLAGSPDSALVCYRQALALKPMNEAVVSKAANILLEAKEYDAVMAMADDYLALDPDNPTVSSIRGLDFFLMGEYDSSLVVFKRLEDMGQDTYPLHYYLGQSYRYTNVPYMADRELRAAWALDSSDANLAWTIAAVQAEIHYPYDRSVKKWLDKANELVQPDSSFISKLHQQYALGEAKEGRYTKAIEHYETAYRYNPSFISALSSIGYCYELLKDYKKALTWYEKYLTVGKPGSSGYKYVEKSIEYVKGELFMKEE